MKQRLRKKKPFSSNQLQHMWDLWDATAKGLGTGHIQGGVAVVKQPSMPEIKEEQENNE